MMGSVLVDCQECVSVGTQTLSGCITTVSFSFGNSTDASESFAAGSTGQLIHANECAAILGTVAGPGPTGSRISYSFAIGLCTTTATQAGAIGKNITNSTANTVEIGFSDATKAQFSTAGINSLAGFGMNGVGAQAQQANTVGPAAALRTFGFIAAGGNPYPDWTPAGGPTQTANFALIGPTTGAAATPTFRALVAGDLPLANSDAVALVTGSNFTTTGQSLTNVTGLSLALIANATYLFEASLSVASSAVTGNQYGVQFSQSGASVEAQIYGILAAASVQCARINALNTATATFDTAGADGAILIKGIMTVGANAGNLTIQTLKVTNGTATVYINSYLKATRIL
jgi:hypothetical protein